MTLELKLDASQLADAAAWIAKMPNGSDPMTAAVEVSTLHSGLQLRRTDGAQFREAVIPAQGADNGHIAVRAANLASHLKGAWGQAIITVDAQALTIRLDTGTIRLRAMDAELPQWPQFTSAATTRISSEQVARVLTSIGTDEFLPQLTAAYFDDGNVVTTDRFRMTRINFAESGITTLVPGAALRAFVHSDVLVNVAVNDTGRLVRLSSSGQAVIMAVPDTEFPRWRSLIPAEPLLSIYLNRADLLAAAGGEVVTLTVRSDGYITVLSRDEADEVEVEQDITATPLHCELDEPLVVTMKSKYLIDCLRAISSGTVLFDATAANKPVMFRSLGDVDLHLIMPYKKAG